MADSAPPFPTDTLKAGWSIYSLSEMRSDRSVRDDTFAVVDHAALTIEVAFCYSYAQASKSLLHEILHIVYRLWVIQEGDTEERDVAMISHGMATIWRDNPELMSWIHEGLSR